MEEMHFPSSLPTSVFPSWVPRGVRFSGPLLVQLHGAASLDFLLPSAHPVLLTLLSPGPLLCASLSGSGLRLFSLGPCPGDPALSRLHYHLVRVNDMYSPSVIRSPGPLPTAGDLDVLMALRQSLVSTLTGPQSILHFHPETQLSKAQVLNTDWNPSGRLLKWSSETKLGPARGEWRCTELKAFTGDCGTGIFRVFDRCGRRERGGGRDNSQVMG